MSDESLNSKKTIKHLRRGLSIYKTGRSPFWHARIYDAVKKKYVVRSTKETNRIEASEVAEEIVDTYKKKQNTAHAVSRERSFEHYAKMLSEITKQKARASKGRSGRVIPLNMELRLKLTDLLEQERQHHRFDIASSHVIRTERSDKTSPQAIVNMFASWFSDVGLRGCSSHSGRRTFITHAARNIS